MAKKGKRSTRRSEASAQAADAARAAAQPAAEAAADGDERAATGTAASTPPSHAGGASARPQARDGVSSARPAPIDTTLANAFIVLFLAYQVAMPLRYYLGERGYDERFSWRMFSTIRMQSCKVEVREQIDGNSEKLDLSQEIHVAWVNMLERYRRPVVDKLLARRCARGEASSVQFSHSCTNTDGSAVPSNIVTMDCKSKTLRLGPATASAESAP